MHPPQPQNLLNHPYPAQKQVILCERQTARLGARPMRITCLTGLVWITREGDLEDIVLEAGDTFNTAPRGLVVAQVISDTMVEITRQ